MDDINVKICVVCHTEEFIDDFHDKYRECRRCIFKRVLKRYYDNKDGIL